MTIKKRWIIEQMEYSSDEDETLFGIDRACSAVKSCYGIVPESDSRQKFLSNRSPLRKVSIP